MVCKVFYDLIWFNQMSAINFKLKQSFGKKMLGRKLFIVNSVVYTWTNINPLPALTHQSVLDLNAACRSKRTEAYWLFSS